MHETKSRNPKLITITPSRVPELKRAISTAGGVAKAAVAHDFSLLKFPHIAVVGEMLDWDAPTGGYLLQACFSTAHFAATAMARKLNSAINHAAAE